MKYGALTGTSLICTGHCLSSDSAGISGCVWVCSFFRGDRKIFFADDEAALSEANKQNIDLILQSFRALPDGKIAINSYNYDDGNDVFKKKRQSLDRAIAVRSYLLSKNYKNFSIKVVNVTDDDSKKNLVEIEEIK